MLESHLEYIEIYNALEEKEKQSHKAMLVDLLTKINEPSGSYPVILGLLLAEKREFSVLLNGTAEPLGDENFMKALRSAYKDAVYAYQKRLAMICGLCLEDRSIQYRFCGIFTSFDNIDCVAELIAVPFGTLRRLQKAAADRRQISKIRSCAVKLKTPLENVQAMIKKAQMIK
ncbi:MAG: hypothetical protein IKB34_04625 [Clostridia bacterium]|nr:hypothetical protein [Clostridia bacterium]